jgi:hypothetical protein
MVWEASERLGKEVGEESSAKVDVALSGHNEAHSEE